MTSSETDQVRALYDSAAPVYQQKFLEVNRYGARVSDFLAANAREGQRWLDLGCGPGNLTAALPSSIEVIGLDVSEEMLLRARELRPSGKYFAHDFHFALPLGSCSVDGAVAIGCFEFCRDPVQVFSNLARVLKPGAQLLFTVGERRASLEHQQDPTAIASTANGNVTMYFWSFAEIASALEQAGFSPVSYEFAPGWVAGSFEGALIHYGWWHVRRE